MSLMISYLSQMKPRVSRILLSRLKNAVLGTHYSLSVVFSSSSHLRRLNSEYRKRDTPTDILSFPLSKTEGEILISTAAARREAIKFGRPFDNFLLFLLIHGFFHLKGMKHGSRMEREEEKFRRRFNI